MAGLTLGSLDLLLPPFKALIGTSAGEWVPITKVSDALFVDGSIVTGDSTGNREIPLRVVVKAVSRSLLAASCEALVSELNAPSNLMTWTPDGGLPQVYETYRAGQLQRTDDEAMNSLRREYTVTIPARPFVRSAVREQAVASPPGVPVDDMESSALGVVMGQQVPGLSNTGWSGTVATAAPTVDASVSPVARFIFGSVLAAVSVTGGTAAAATAAPGSVSVTRVTASAAGTVLVQTGLFATSADYITADWAAVLSVTTPDFRSYQAGIEWRDASNNVVRTDWGAVSSFNTSSIGAPRAVWEAAPRPSTATKVRGLLRLTATAVESFDIYAVTLQPSAGGTITPSSAAHDGSASLGVWAGDLIRNEDGSGTTYFYVYRAGMYARRALPAALDLSGQTRMRAWLQTSNASNLADANPAVRLWDAAGNWSRYQVAVASMVPTGTWVQVGADLASPTETSTTPCNLAAVVAYDFLATTTRVADYNVTPVAIAVYLDTLTAGPADTPNMSPRGTVLTLDPIKGSARTTAAVTLTNGTAMTDWLVACIDGTDGAPLLTVTSNKATAGVGYDGTYSVIAALTPATSLASPTCTVVQKVGGTTVATQVLTGLQKTGNRYIDFGSVALPLVAVPAENTNVTYEFTLAPTSTAYAELLVIDVDASLAWMANLSTPRKVAMIDEPLPEALLGKVWQGDLVDRSDAMAPLNPPVTPSPIRVQAPSTRLLVYSTTGAPSVILTYWPRWLAEPTS